MISLKQKLGWLHYHHQYLIIAFKMDHFAASFSLFTNFQQLTVNKSFQ